MYTMQEWKSDNKQPNSRYGNSAKNQSSNDAMVSKTMEVNELALYTDNMLQLWIREYRYQSPDYQTSALGGDLALTETRNYRNGAVMFQRKENGELVKVAKSRIHANESPKSKSVKLQINEKAELVEAIMCKLKKVNITAYLALTLSYEGHSQKEIGERLKISKSYAQRYKENGFNMVMMELA